MMNVQGSMNWSAVAAQAASIPQRDSRGNLRLETEPPTRIKNKRSNLSPRNQSSASLKHESEPEVDSKDGIERSSKDRQRMSRKSAQQSLDGPQTSESPSGKKIVVTYRTYDAAVFMNNYYNIYETVKTYNTYIAITVLSKYSHLVIA